MRKLLSILATLTMTTSLAVNVAACDDTYPVKTSIKAQVVQFLSNGIDASSLNSQQAYKDTKQLMIFKLVTKFYTNIELELNGDGGQSPDQLLKPGTNSINVKFTIYHESRKIEKGEVGAKLLNVQEKHSDKENVNNICNYFNKNSIPGNSWSSAVQGWRIIGALEQSADSHIHSKESQTRISFVNQADWKNKLKVGGNTFKVSIRINAFKQNCVVTITDVPE